MDDDADLIGFVVPWSGEVIIDPNPPADLPAQPGAQPVPIAGPAIKIIQSGAQYVWNDVWNWTSGAFRAANKAEAQAFTVTAENVINVAESAISWSQTAWSSFISILTSALEAEIYDVGNYAVNLGAHLRASIVTLYNDIYVEGGLLDDLITSVYDTLQGNIRNIEALLGALSVDLPAAIEAWAIDNIYNPLVDDFTVSIDNVETVLGEAVQGIDGRLAQIENIDLPSILETLGLVVAGVTAITTWVDDCGEPMCENFGPGSELGGLLDNALLKYLLGLLALGAFADPRAVADAALAFAEVGGKPVEAAIENWLEPIQAVTPG